MKKAADLQDIIQRTGSTLSSGLQGAGSSIHDWYNKMDPDVRNAILRGLAGATVGGLATGGMAAATPKLEGEKNHVMGPALLGSFLGGTAAAAIPYGAKMIAGDVHLPGIKDRKPAGSSLIDKITYPASKHLGALGGLGAGIVLGPSGNKGTNWNEARDLINYTPKDTETTRPVIEDLVQKLRTRLGKSSPVLDKLLTHVEHAAPKVGPHADSALEIGRFAGHYGKALPKALLEGVKGHSGALKGMAGIPVGLLLGVLADKYMQGEY